MNLGVLSPEILLIAYKGRGTPCPIQASVLAPKAAAAAPEAVRGETLLFRAHRSLKGKVKV